MSALVSLVPDGVALLPNLKAAYNSGAKRFINNVTKRFITNKMGYLKDCVFPATGIIIGVTSKVLDGDEE